MPDLVLDSGGVSWLATESRRSNAVIDEFKRTGLWPAVIPTAVLIECLGGQNRRDVAANRLIKTCRVVETLPTKTARRAATLRTTARRGSAVDALVVTLAEPGGTVLTGDPDDLRPLAASAVNVTIRPI